ncbi:MAG: ABC transporter substrate-binding protein [SAR202 cluster bacterium]|nr:ABC transporter substrate-binding protein [SAR202 cluster bacterium]
MPKTRFIKHLPTAIVLLFVTLLFACGSSATAIPQSGDSSSTAPTDTAVSTVAPTATPQATEAPSAEAKRGGTLNIGLKETGIFEAHPRLSSSPRIQYTSSSVGEGMIAIQKDLTPGPLLAKSWSISDDFLTWTWKLQEGVQFHKGYGELTVEDVLYSYEQFFEGALHGRAGIIGDFWAGDEGGFHEIVDDYTVKVNTGRPWVPAVAFEFMRNLGGASTWIVSKKQSDEIGAEAASKDIAATGPWQIEEHSSGEFWKMSAVQDHWRQTPYFDELVYWTIPEESARVAGFQTGQLDNFDMAFDTIPTVEGIEGATLVGWPNAGQAGLNLYGQTYGTDRDGNPYKDLDCTNAWVSCDDDPDSAEWANTVKVKKALAIAIDRDAIVATILSGFGAPLAVRDWMGFEDQMDPSWVFDYNPERAKELLAEAGYPDGFSITLTPALRGAPAEVEACEAVGQYWDDIGINVKFQSVPYATIRPSLITRQYQGATCHTLSQRLTPVIGYGNYVKNSTFSYGTEHPWMEENITDALQEVNPVKLREKEIKLAGWMYENVMGFGLYAHDGVWPIGPRVNPDWAPLDYSEVRLATAFEYAKPR